MIIELSRENCWSLSQTGDESVLVAYLSATAYSRQLRALIELSDTFSDGLRIYVTRDTALKISTSMSEIAGSPTYILLRNAGEQGRLLGESDVRRLKKFVGGHLAEQVESVDEKTQLSPECPLYINSNGRRVC